MEINNTILVNSFYGFQFLVIFILFTIFTKTLHDYYKKYLLKNLKENIKQQLELRNINNSFNKNNNVDLSTNTHDLNCEDTLLELTKLLKKHK